MAKGKKSSLKSTLQSQQSRLKKRQKAERAAQVAEQNRKKNPQSKGKGKAPPQRSTIPFNPTDRILLIGEGNFSFARALTFNVPASLEQLPPRNITATSYDAENDCYVKYPDAKIIVQGLREKGVEVLFDVDATKLKNMPALKGRKWDRIVWNFPHAGKGITDQDRNILTNQMLILGFLCSSAPFLAVGPIPSFSTTRKKKQKSEDDDDVLDDADEDDDDDGFGQLPRNINTGKRGTLLVTLRNVVPYTKWDVPRLAKKPPAPTSASIKPNPVYTLLRSFAFNRQMWNGYEHRMTKGERAHGHGKTGEGGEDRTWEFCLGE